MSAQTCFIAFGTFGSPNGFKQTFFIGGNAGIAKSIRTFDLKTDAIQLFPKTKVYAVRKEQMNGTKAVSYSLYTYAKEPNSDRGGTFIGSSILYLDKMADEGSTISCLNEFHEKLISKNVQHDVISVSHSDQFAVSKPSGYEKLISSPKEIEDLNFHQLSNRNLVVYSDVSAASLQRLFAQAMPLLDVYDTIYITAGKEVAEFVYGKNLFQLVQGDGFDEELQKLQDEKTQRVQLMVAEYKAEKEKLDEDKKRVFLELKEQVDTNEKTHAANKKKLDELKAEFNAAIQKYEGYEKKIDEAIRQLTEGKKPNAVRQVLAENKRIFIESVNEQRAPLFINNIPSPKAIKTELKPNLQSDVSQPSSPQSDNRHRRHKKRRLDKFKIASFVLVLLWMGTLAYFLFFAKGETVLTEAPKPETQAPALAPLPAAVKPELNPKPNATLSGTTIRAVLKRLPPRATADSLVNVIFEKNPEEVKRYYSSQKEVYTQYLIEQNESFFEKKDSTFYLSRDTLGAIPSYKPEL